MDIKINGKPKMLSREQNGILLTWQNVFETTESNVWYIIQLLDPLREWRTVYCPHLIDAPNKENKTPLMQAVEKGDLQICAFLINMGANVNATSLHVKKTPLMFALFTHKLDVAEFLIEKGANPDLTDINELNILHYAVDSNNLQSVQFALKYVCCLDTKDTCGWTPLLRAVILGCDKDIIHLLIEHGASFQVKDKNGFGFVKHCNLAKRSDLVKLYQNKSQESDVTL